MADNDTEQAKQAKRHPPTDKSQPGGSGTAPPMPKGREGVPNDGPLPHGQEPARPRDTGRHGA